MQIIVVYSRNQLITCSNYFILIIERLVLNHAILIFVKSGFVQSGGYSTQIESIIQTFGL